jgi:TrmH family RNA methyltransferase
LNEVITSKQNPIVRHIRALNSKKYREENQQFFVEGIKLTLEACKEGASISFLLFSDEFDYSKFTEKSEACFEHIKSFRLSRRIFDDISDCSTPQGIIAVINRKDNSISETIGKEEFFLVILDEVRDPGNVGTIIRTLDAAGADGLVLLGGCADPYSPKVVRSTMGSIFRVPVYEIDDYRNFFYDLKNLDAHIMVGHTQGEDLFGWKGGSKRIALVIGNESNGVRPEIRDFSTSTVTIPMSGKTESLNAATAAGLMIYEIYRKKHYKQRSIEDEGTA